MTNTLPDLIALEPQFHSRVWGGRRLQPNSPQPIGEAWLVHESNRVAGSDYTLGELARLHGPALLGRLAGTATTRFPLLIKLLDCTDWLSVQVHPNDAQAAALEGAGSIGKTEAWHILETQPGAGLLVGVKPGTTSAALADAIRLGRPLEVCQRESPVAGDTFYVPAGTMHALGPGLFVYEVQQNSDITYRVWDWDRPAAAGRALHIAQSLAVSKVDTGAFRVPASSLNERILNERYFALDRVSLSETPRTLATAGDAPLAITSIDAFGSVACRGFALPLQPLCTVLVPAAAPPVSLTGTGGVLIARPNAP